MPKLTGASVTFLLANKRGDNKPADIQLVMRYPALGGTKVVRYSIGAKIPPLHWDKKKQRPRATMPQYNSIKEKVDKYEQTALEVYRLGIIDTEEVKKAIRYRIDGRNPGDIDNLLDFAILIDGERQSSNELADNTKKHLSKFIFQLRAYSKAGGNLSFTAISHSFYNNFKTFLFEQGLRINTVGIYAGQLKLLMREARRRKLHTSIDFEDFEIKRVETTQIALTEEEIKTLYNFDFSNTPHIEEAVNIFLVGCYSGLRYSDISKLTYSHIHTLGDGTRAIKIEATQKTKTPVIIPIRPELERLLTKLPFTLSNERLIDYLQIGAQMIGGTFMEEIPVRDTKGGKISTVLKPKYKLLGSHVGRRSFATNLYRRGIPAIQIMMMTGHKTEKEFMKYIRVTQEDNAMNLAKLFRDLG